METARLWLEKLDIHDVDVVIIHVDDPTLTNGSFELSCHGSQANTENESKPAEVQIACRPLIEIVFPTQWPSEVGELILLHELGHRDQWFRGELFDIDYALDPKPFEWSADVWGAQTWCKLGGDPRWIVKHWRMIRATGYKGSEDHGTPAERTENVRQKATNCNWKGIDTYVDP